MNGAALRCGLSIAGLGLLSGSLAVAAPRGDLMIRGARVLTMDPARPTATTVVVRGGVILYVGDGGDTDPPPPADKTVDASAFPGGLTVLPGLIDAHAHLVGLGLSLRALDLRGQVSPAAIAALVQQAAGGARGGAQSADWVLGRGWDQNRFHPPVMPTHDELDRAAPGRPVWLRRIDGHAGWASAEALRRAGISAATADPPGGKILRDAVGAPTGVLVDNAMDLVERALPAPRASDLEQAILRGAEHAVRLGLTGVHDMGLSPEAVAAYQRLAEAGRLPLRVYGFAADPVPTALAQAPTSPAYRGYLDRLGQILGSPRTGPFFSLRGVKLYIDGALGSRGAALLAPYSDESANQGLLVAPREHIESMARWGAMHGYQIATHAIGDRGNRLVLDAYQQAGVRPDRDLRFRVEHAQIVATTDQTRFAQLGVIASMQPTHATSDGPWAGARLGAVRLRTAYAWRSLLQAGARLCFGSDFPVEAADPRLGLHAAVQRSALSAADEVFGPTERLTVGEAIRLFTADAAYAAFEENRLGQVMAGRPADLTVLAGTLSLDEPRPADLHRREVVLTLVDGKIVYDGRRAGPPSPGAR